MKVMLKRVVMMKQEFNQGRGIIVCLLVDLVLIEPAIRPIGFD